MEMGWELPLNGFIKANVHAENYGQVNEIGNDSGLGVVLRDHTGEIILMVSGTIRNLTPRANELWAMLIALRCSFYEKRKKVVLETENAEAVREWEDWRWFLDPNHHRVIDQLEKRKNDKNIVLQVNVIQQSQNTLARYLAADGAQHRNRLVVFRRAFGRVRELWHLDMGLGFVGGNFDLLEEEDYLQQQQQEIDDEINGVGEWLVHDVGSPNVAL